MTLTSVMADTRTSDDEILQLQIAVRNAVLVAEVDRRDHLLEHVDSHLLRVGLGADEVVIQLAARAELADDDQVLGVLEGVHQLDDVGMVEVRHDVHLPAQVRQLGFVQALLADLLARELLAVAFALHQDHAARHARAQHLAGVGRIVIQEIGLPDLTGQELLQSGAAAPAAAIGGRGTVGWKVRSTHGRQGNTCSSSSRIARLVERCLGGDQH